MSDLPEKIEKWFKSKGWQPHPHQIAMFDLQEDGLLIAPTGGGKTLAGFLPSLAQLEAGHEGLHTLYVSPLKALAADVARNLERPIAEMGLEITLGQRTGDSSASERRKWRAKPPHILLTTPESLALMLSWPEADRLFKGLRRVILDEIHALVEDKRGDQLLLCLARLRGLQPNLQLLGLSATVEAPEALADWIGAQKIVLAPAGPPPDIALLPTQNPPPWAGQGGRYAVADVIAAVKEAKITLIFHNTRAQAELFFQALWLANEENLPIALHHGALSREGRQKVEAAIVAGELRAVVATGTLDLGLDWGDVDQVIQIGGPRNIKRLVQRIGRAGHRYNVPSRARIVPANRFEVIEATAAIEAAMSGQLDHSPRRALALDVLIQHMLLTACSAPFDADQFYHEVIGTGPYRTLSRADFDACLDCAATGGYVLRAYDRYQRLMPRDGLWGLRDPRAARILRMNIGTIQEAEKLKVRRLGRGGAELGLIEESFAASLRAGDTFLLGGQVLAFERIRELVVEVRPASGRDPKIASFYGQSLSITVELAQAMLRLISSQEELPAATREWLHHQAQISSLPRPKLLVSESFAYRDRHYLALYGFSGRNAHQTLGLLLTQRFEAEGLDPTGFLALDHGLLISALQQIGDPAPYLDPKTLLVDFEEWLAGSSLMKRTFRAVATIAGLIQRQELGARKTGRQATFSSDILFETLRRHDPNHVLLRATRRDADHGLVDFERLSQMLELLPERRHNHLTRVSPFAAPMLLQLGQVKLAGAAQSKMAEAEAAALMRLAGG